MDIFTKPINKKEYHIIALGFRETLNKIRTRISQNPFRNGQGLQHPWVRCNIILVPLGKITLVDNVSVKQLLNSSDSCIIPECPP